MFLRREFSERDSEAVFRLVFVPFGWPFGLPLISVLQRNTSKVLKFFLFVESIVLLWRNVFSNVFFVVAYCYISKLFYCRLGAIELLFLLCVFCTEITSFSAIFLPLQSR